MMSTITRMVGVVLPQWGSVVCKAYVAVIGNGPSYSSHDDVPFSSAAVDLIRLACWL